MIGQTISHYKILEKLGEGGMGVVYKAEDTKLKRIVAIKFLPRHVSAGKEERERFAIEAQSAASLNQPNIATIYSIEERDDEMFIVMEYIEGKELKAIVKEAQPSGIPVDAALRYAEQISLGLRAAHTKGIIHRDIKSANIMITPEGQAKIMDFGLAKFKGSVNLTRTGSTLGTAAYMSPEQIRGEDVDEHADIWAFGVVIFELVTGELPFRGEHESAMMYSITNEDPKDLAALRSGIPVGLQQIIRRCLEKDRSRRYRSMNEVLEDISKLKPAAGVAVESLSVKAFSNSLRRPIVAIPLVLILLGLGYLTYRYVDHNAKIRWAQDQALPEIDRLVGESKWTGAYLLARQIEGDVGNDPLFVKLRPLYAQTGVIKTDPPRAKVLITDYADSSGDWVSLGKTPTDTIFLPRGLWRLKLLKDGYTIIDGAGTVGLVNQTVFKLDPVGSIPDDMVHVPGGKYGLNVPGLDHLPRVEVGGYLIDKFEVSNKAFKEFLDQGGYQKKEYWKHPFVKNERTLTWEEAIKEFVDATGRSGPATWELGMYPEGKVDYPVGGISWYEAAAYAEFRGKTLPTIYHWNIAAETRMSAFIIQASNFDNKGTAPVGKYTGVSPFGTRDMAGNVREWCFNESGKQRCIPGGGWNDQPYMFTDFYAQPPFDRSSTNGVRCMKVLEPEKTGASYASIVMPHRDFLKEKPVSDPIFNIYLSLYKYDKTALNSNIESSDATADWIMQKVTFDAAYGNERMIAYLFLPKAGTLPYQTVVYFPGSSAIFDRSSKSLQFGSIDFIVKSGRALVYPIYKGTYERGSGLDSDYPSETSSYREHVIAWAKDLGRSIDYLETRNDFDTEKLAYYGLSWGGAMGAIMPAVEPRIKVSVLYVAGLLFQPALPEVEGLNFISRIRIPVIMLNGKYDHFFPVETSQKPMFALLGTPPQNKKYVLYETGHFVPRNQLIKESLDWLDTYLGPVK